MFKLFLLSLSVISYTAVEVQIKFNGNFETLDANGNPTGWGLTFNGQNTYEIKVNSVVKRQGKYAISITPGNSKISFSAIDFPIKKSFHGKKLTLIGSIKTENVTGGWAGLWLLIDGKDEKVLSFENM